MNYKDKSTKGGRADKLGVFGCQTGSLAAVGDPTHSSGTVSEEGRGGERKGE